MKYNTNKIINTREQYNSRPPNSSKLKFCRVSVGRRGQLSCSSTRSCAAFLSNRIVIASEQAKNIFFSAKKPLDIIILVCYNWLTRGKVNIFFYSYYTHSRQVAGDGIQATPTFNCFSVEVAELSSCVWNCNAADKI